MTRKRAHARCTKLVTRLLDPDARCVNAMPPESRRILVGVCNMSSESGHTLYDICGILPNPYTRPATVSCDLNFHARFTRRGTRLLNPWVLLMTPIHAVTHFPLDFILLLLYTLQLIRVSRVRHGEGVPKPREHGGVCQPVFFVELNHERFLENL